MVTHPFYLIDFVSREKQVRKASTFPSISKRGKTREACGTEGGKDRTRVSLLEVPRCLAGPTEGPQSGRLASLRKKDERQRPRVFLI
jgi:hypothetical protein